MILDTYPSFKESWGKVKTKSLDVLLDLWENEYMSRYPELFELQVKSYKDLRVDWRKIAKERVFPKLLNSLQFVEESWRNLHDVIPKAYGRFKDFWRRDFDVIFVIYVGIGCGAGWATEYNKRYAILLGLENIAELRWNSKECLEGLLLHELSHIAHMVLRGLSPEEFEELEEDPLFLLYSEGFATRCEHLILGEERWRIAPSEDWLKWCKDNLSFLASEYLKRVERNESVNDFFGSWLGIEGMSQTGYYLGHEYVKSLERHMSIEEIATMNLNSIERSVKEFLLLSSNSF